ncbi:hypothetical protein CR513_55990, partial [Mucuna pruriens]
MAQYLAKNNERLKIMETQISNLATLMSQRVQEKHVAPSKDEAPTKKILVDVTNKGNDVLTPKKALDISDGAISSNYTNTRKPHLETLENLKPYKEPGAIQVWGGVSMYEEKH